MEPLRSSDPTRISGYRLAGRLGSGGMGVVYLGCTEDGREVAVKVIRRELVEEPEFRVRFRHEVEAMMRVSGQDTVPVIGADPDGDPAWLATAYVPAPTLAEVVKDRGPLPEGEVLKLAAGLAEALCTIHTAGLIHRDLKPGNILLTDDGPRVIDFGIALAAENPRLTRTGVMVGTLAYMSPEQLKHDTVDPRSDVYSLGAVLTFAAIGRPPHGDDDGEATDPLRVRVLSQEPNLDQITGPLRELISACLAKEPRQRPTLERILRGDGADPTNVLKPTEKPSTTKVEPSPAAKRRKLVRRLVGWPVAVAVIAVGAMVFWHFFGKPETLFTKDDAARYLGTPASAITETETNPSEDMNSAEYGSFMWRPIGTSSPTIHFRYTRLKTTALAEKQVEVPAGRSLSQLPNGSNAVDSPTDSGCALQLQNGDLYIVVEIAGAKDSTCGAARDAARVIDDRLGQFL